MLTPEEKQIAEYGKKQGKTAQEVIQAIDKYRGSRIQTQAPKKQSFFGDLMGDIKGVGKDIKDVVLRRGKRLGETLEADVRGEQGKASSVFQAATNLAVAPAEVVGAGIKGVTKAVLTQKAEDKVKETISKFGQKVLSLPETKQFIQNYKDLEKESPEYARNVVALAEGGEFLLTFLGLKGAKDLTKAGVQTGKEVLETGLEQGGKVLGRAGEAVAPVVRGAGELVESTGITRVPTNLATNVQARVATEQAIKSLPSKVAQTAVRDGIDINEVRTLVNVVKQSTKAQMRNLFTTAKKFAGGDKSVNPIEVVGKPIVTGIKALETARKNIGVQLGTIADFMPRVLESEIRPVILSQLKSVPGLEGLKTTMRGVLDFSGTTLASAENKSARIAIRKIFEDAAKGGSAKSKHLLRQELFEVLGGKKAAKVVLTETQDKAYEAIRKGLADILDARNAKYKALNSQYAKHLEPLKELRKKMRVLGAGADEDILDMSAGLLARRLTGAGATGPEIKALLRKMDLVLKNTDKLEDVVEALQNLYNILDRYYAIEGGTSLQGQIKSAISSDSLVGMAKGAIKSVAGESEAVQRKALEKLLNELLGS
jgi:hypothetical protein